MAADKRHAHDLLDQLGPSQLGAVIHLLETMLATESGGESLSPAERQAIAEAEEWLNHNPPIPHEEVLAELGVTTAHWERMGRQARV